MRSKISVNYIYYIAIAGIFFILKTWYTQTTTDSLYYLLKSINGIFEIFNGSKAIYIKTKGFYHEQLDILIDKSCAGFNFFLICFLMISFLIVENRKSHVQKIVCIGVSFICTLFITIITNVYRIIVLVSLESKINSFFPFIKNMSHQLIGITINLFFLMIIYLLIHSYLNKKKYA